MHDPLPKSLCPSTLILCGLTKSMAGTHSIQQPCPAELINWSLLSRLPGLPHSLLSLLPKPPLQFCEVPDILINQGQVGGLNFSYKVELQAFS